MAKLFIAKPSAQDKATLKELGFSWKRHKDGDRNGILLSEPIARTTFAKLVEKKSNLKVTLDSTKATNRDLTALTLRERNSRSAATANNSLHTPKEITQLAAFINRTSPGPCSAADMADDSRRYSEDLKRFRHAHQLLCSTLSAANQSQSELTQELAAICRHPQVTKVTFSPEDNKLCVYTTTLYCKHPKTGLIHRIGRFEINFLLEEVPSPNSISFYNLVFGNLYDCQAPHVFQNGNACLGSLSTALPELLYQGSYFAAVDMAIVFIESVNEHDSWGMKNLANFPICSLPDNTTRSGSKQTVKRGRP